MMYSQKYHKENLSQYSFLVTGGAGFIGANLVEYLLKYEAKRVRVLDNLSTGDIQNVAPFLSNPRFQFIEGDIRDLQTCINAVDGMDFISHQAALGSVPRSVDDPLTTNDVNINGFLNMLIAQKESKTVKNMVYAASSSTYGDSPTLPKVEDNIGKPLSPYAVTKYVNEMYADVFYKTYGTATIGLRYFNVFGPKQSPNGAYAAVIPLFMNSLKSNFPPTIHGSGLQSRDFTFIELAVQANILSFFASKDAENQVYNIAAGNSMQINQLWEYLQQLSQIKINPIYSEARKADVLNSLADVSKAKQLLKYVPNYSAKEGLAITWKYFINQ